MLHRAMETAGSCEHINEPSGSIKNTRLRVSCLAFQELCSMELVSSAGGMWKGEAFTCFKVLSWHLLRQIEETYYTCQDSLFLTRICTWYLPHTSKMFHCCKKYIKNSV
jgi:hypothetical protein